MKYTGSKRRIARYISPFIYEALKNKKYYVEPFVGGANMLSEIDFSNRIAADTNVYVIALHKALQKGWQPPKLVTENMFYEVRENKQAYSPALVGYIGFNFCFAKFFDCYRRDVAGAKGSLLNQQIQSKRAFENVTKQAERLKDVHFELCSYLDLEIPADSVVYCDPPYAGTYNYKNKEFNTDEFFGWCRSLKNCTVLISEYSAPDDFILLWQKQMTQTLDATRTKKVTEKLFTYL